jgi:hypothetical protein
MLTIRWILRRNRQLRSWDENPLFGIAPDVPENILCHTLSRENWGFPSFRDLLRHEILSEYDALLLSRYIQELGMALSEDFKSFEKDWVADELRHHMGFRQLYAHLYGKGLHEIDATLEGRGGQFDKITRFLGDEFGLLVLLGYDEIVTTKAYARDLPIYDSFGQLGISKFIRLVARDEVFHFQRIVEILRARFADRIAEVPALLEVIVAVDSRQGSYRGTFVLDHGGFPMELLASASMLMKRLCEQRTLPMRQRVEA